MFFVGAGNTVSTLFAIAVSIFVYGIVLLLIKGITKNELKAMPMGGKLAAVFTRLGLM